VIAKIAGIESTAKHQVGGLDQDQRESQRRQHQRAGLGPSHTSRRPRGPPGKALSCEAAEPAADHEVLTVEVRGDREQPAREAHRQVAVEVGLAAPDRQHLDAGEDQEGPNR